MVDDWYDYQTLSTLGYSESNIMEYTEKQNTEKNKKAKYNLVWKKIIMALLSEGWGGWGGE